MSASSEEMIELVFGPLNAVKRAKAPTRIYFDGNISLPQQGTRIAVVGTREPSDLGVRRTRQLVDKLVEHGVIVGSGLALGIDTIAHTRSNAADGRSPSSELRCRTSIRDRTASFRNESREIISSSPNSLRAIPPCAQTSRAATERWLCSPTPRSSSRRMMGAERCIKDGRRFDSDALCSF